MLEAWPLDARAVAAAGALLALPGFVVVRSPWRAMPLLSLTFWVISWTWLGGAARTRCLHAALAALLALALLRVLRPGPLPRPLRAHLLLAAVAVLACLPPALRTVPSGPRMPLESVTAELLAWHDGWPVSFEPLLPVLPFRASGLALLGGDVVLLTGAPPHRAVLIVAAVAQLALLLAVWSLAALRASPASAALVTALALLTVAIAGAGVGAGTLATAFAVQSVALWHDRRGHPSAFTAGACTAAAFATDPATALSALAVAAAGAYAIVRRAPSRTGDSGAVGPHRLRTAVLTALVLSLPLLLRRPPLFPPEPAPLVALSAVVLLSFASLDPRRKSLRHLAIAAVVAVGVAAAFSAVRARSGDVASGDAAAMEWIRVHAHPLDLVCAPDVPAARWIPVLAARPASVSVWPGWPVPNGPCAVRLALSGAAAPGWIPHPRPEFGSDTAAVWTTSQGR